MSAVSSRLISAVIVFFVGLQPACSYLQGVYNQADFIARYKSAPSQKTYKHMLESPNFFVFGLLENGKMLNEEAMAVLALSSLHQRHELVDISHFSRISSFYGLNLPEGEYRLVVVSDLNSDGFYEGWEIVGSRKIELKSQPNSEKVVSGYDIDLDQPLGAWSRPVIRLSVRKQPQLPDSLFYPKGSIRQLDDEIFSPRMATLGMYEPAAFLEEAPMMFYALEEDLGYKVPVVFVHGINGSARDFAPMVARLDRQRYKAWFFHYPSGNDLDQLAEMFYRIFLSGKTVQLGGLVPMVIIAHSMGGLVVREAMNRMAGGEDENRVISLVTLASPMAGHPAAAMAGNGPVVLPSWQDVSPESPFMQGLHRRPLPEGTAYHLVYAYTNEATIKLGSNSDGVVPLASQLCQQAQQESTSQRGFDATHTGILQDPQALEYLLSIIEAVPPPLPDEHMVQLFKGGFPEELGEEYSPVGRYCINNIGHWLAALASGKIAPIDAIQAHFVAVCLLEARPETELEKDWMRFTGGRGQRRQQ